MAVKGKASPHPVLRCVIAAQKCSRSATRLNALRCFVQVTTTISQGRVVWHNGKLHVQPGTGRFIQRPRFPPIFEGLTRMDAAWLQKNFPYGRTPVWRGGGLEAAHRDEL